MYRLIYLFLPLFLFASSYEYELSIAAIFNNEGRFLKEWIEFHKTVGVEHFYLYNNRSNDNFADVLKPYVEEGTVELIEWPHKSRNTREWNDVQCNAFMDAVKRAKGVSRWLALIDIDEFIFTTDKTLLPDFLSSYRKYGGLAVNWQCYGTSDIARLPDDRFLIEMLVMKAPVHIADNCHVKSIVQPKKVSNCRNPHFCTYRKDYYAVSPSKVLIPDFHNDAVDISRIRINHYWSRDEEFVTQIKIPRQLKWWGKDAAATWEKYVLSTRSKIKPSSIGFLR